jgi:hypothetical protein
VLYFQTSLGRACLFGRTGWNMRFRSWVPFWVIPCLILMAIGTVWLRLAIVRTTYSINQANKEIRNLQLEKEQMELRVAALRSPRRLEILSRAKFGLSQPKSDRIVHLKTPPLLDDRIVTSTAVSLRASGGN